MSVKIKARPEWINVRRMGISGSPTEQISQATLNKVFALHTATKRPVFFPDGTYVFPKTFNYFFGMNSVHIIGESRDGVKITSDWGTDTTRIVERIDISFPKVQADGFYRINVTGVPDASWSALSNPDIDDYIKIVSGVPSFATLSEIKAAGYITELDVTLADPAIDGKYVVASTNDTLGGGGYTHSNFPYNTSLKYITGTMVQRSGGVWSRMAPSKGFEFGGNFRIENITFEGCEFYLFTPNNTTQPDFDYYDILNCRFRHVIRVNAHDRQYQASAIQSQGFIKGQLYHIADGQRFNYKRITFENNECEYIHTCIFWEFPPTRELNVRRNVIKNCYSFTELFIYLPMGSSSTDDSEDSEGYTNRTVCNFENNYFENCIHYSPVSHGGHHMMRGNGNGRFFGNRFINCTGSILYASGNGNDMLNNVIYPYVQLYPDREVGKTWGRPAIFHIKTGNQKSVSTTLIAHNKVEKAAMIDIIDIKNTNTFLKVDNNKVSCFGYAEQILTTDDKELNRELLHLIRDVNTFLTLTSQTGAPDWAAGVYTTGTLVLYNSVYYQCVVKTTAGDADPATQVAAGLNTSKWREIKLNTYVYWDIRRRKWMYFPATQGRDSGFIDKNYNSNSDYPISISNNTIYAYNLLQCVDGIFNDITFNNNTIFIDRDLISQSVGSQGYGSHVETMRLYGNAIYRNSLAPSTKYFNSINNLIATDNDFYYALAYYDIAFRKECHWIENRVRPWLKFAKAGNISSLSLPSSSAATAVVFRRQMPATWTAGTYGAGTFRAYNNQVYEAISDVVSGDGAPDVTPTKWQMVDDPLLYIRNGSFDSYMARTAALTWQNLNRVSIEGTTFIIRLINDWSSIYRTVAAGGTSNRFAFLFATANAAPTRDVNFSGLKFDFEDRNNRHMFYIAGANSLQFTNFTVNDIPKYGSFPLNKMVYVVSGATMSIGKLNMRGADQVAIDTNFENAVAAKEYSNREVLTLTANGSFTIPKGTLVDTIIIKSTTAIASLKIGSTSGGTEYDDLSIDANISTPILMNIFDDSASRTLYFNGITGSGGTTTITIFKR